MSAFGVQTGTPIADSEFASIQLQFFLNLRPWQARRIAVGALGAFNGSRILDIFDSLSHLTQQCLGLDKLFVETGPIAPRFRF